MAISITCAQCRHSLTVGDEWAGKRGKCPKCQAVVASGTISVSRYLLKMIPPAEEVGAIYHAADELLGGLAMLNARCLGRLCVMAEAVETALGYHPLPGKPTDSK